MAWLADGSGLLVLATDQEFLLQIWHLSYPEGKAQRVTNELKHYSDLTLTANSGALVTVQDEIRANIWIAPDGDAARAKQITSGAGKAEGGLGISWAPDGRIVYDSYKSGGSDIWITDADGRNQKQLTANVGYNSHPAVTPDGRYIFFLSDRTGTPHIWRMDFDGSNQKQLTSGPGSHFQFR
jgi:tricorn protease-like protein